MHHKLLSGAVFAVLTSVVLSDRQVTFSNPLSLKSNFEDALFKLEEGVSTIKNEFSNLNLQDLAKDWEGKILSHAHYPNQAVRIKEPKLCDRVQQYSGYLDTASDKHFFFWFFESRDNPSRDPLVLWLNGGPGCSSLTGLLMELGPCQVHKNGNGTSSNPYSWNQNANVIFLDQPLNAGFSYGSSVSNTVAASDDVYAFLQLFFKEFPQYRKLDFHIFGESYAGHYVPEFAKHIFESNKEQREENKIKLKSVGVGNGLTDPLVQYDYYPKMACENSYKPVLSKSECRSMESKLPRCRTLIQSCYNYPSFFTCTPASIYCNQALIGPYQRTGMNPYDVRRKCGNNDLCYDIIGDMEMYLNRPDVKKELGARNSKFESCNMGVNMAFNQAGDWMKPFVRDVPILLEGGIRVLIYAGDADFICNWMGNKAWTIELPWSGQKEFSKAKDHKWLNSETGKPAGELRSYKNFAFLRLFEAGHMVPYDQPENAHDMITRWLHDRSL